MDRIPQRFVQEFPVSGITQDPDNPWSGDDESVAESIDALGFYGAVLVHESGRLIAGHSRLRKALADGEETIPTFVLDVDDETARRILVRDNVKGKGRFLDEPLRNILLHLNGQDRGLAGTGFKDQDLGKVMDRLDRAATSGVRATHSKQALPDADLVRCGECGQMRPRKAGE